MQRTELKHSLATEHPVDPRAYDAMNLFENVTTPEGQHPLFRMLCDERNAPERAVLSEWANGLVDRDGKFAKEFQLTFEPCLWELYLFAILKELGADLDQSFHAPDFVGQRGQAFCMEATIAAPAKGDPVPFGKGAPTIPTDLSEFNRQSTLRITNSFSSKVKRYRESYAKLAHVADKPFVIAIGSYDRPASQLASNRPIMSALYGLYYDEELTISTGADSVINYEVSAVAKSEDIDVPLGYFLDDSYSDVSAVVYSCLATWGKLRALADRSDANMQFTSFHPNPGSLAPAVRTAMKRDYREHLVDGLYVFHNPSARIPLDTKVLAHSRAASIRVEPDGELIMDAPDDFLLSRFLFTVTSKVRPE